MMGWVGWVVVMVVVAVAVAGMSVVPSGLEGGAASPGVGSA